MARAKKIKTEEVKTDVAVTTATADAPAVRTVKLSGGRGSSLDVSINGVPAKLPCGVEFEVSEELYDIIKPYTV